MGRVFEEANSVVVEVHGVDIGDGEASDLVYDDVVFVERGGRQAERAVCLDAVQCAAAVLRWL